MKFGRDVPNQRSLSTQADALDSLTLEAPRVEVAVEVPTLDNGTSAVPTAVIALAPFDVALRRGAPSTCDPLTLTAFDREGRVAPALLDQALRRRLTLRSAMDESTFLGALLGPDHSLDVGDPNAPRPTARQNRTRAPDVGAPPHAALRDPAGWEATKARAGALGRAPGGAARRRLGGGGGGGDGYVDFDEDCGDIYDHCQAFSWDETYDVMICVSASRAACFYFSSTERDDDANYDAITAVVDTDGPNDVLGKVLSWTDGEFDGYWNAAVYGYALEDVAEGSAQDEHRDLEGGFYVYDGLEASVLVSANAYAVAYAPSEYRTLLLALRVERDDETDVESAVFGEVDWSDGVGDRAAQLKLFAFDYLDDVPARFGATLHLADNSGDDDGDSFTGDASFVVEVAEARELFAHGGAYYRDEGSHHAYGVTLNEDAAFPFNFMGEVSSTDGPGVDYGFSVAAYDDGEGVFSLGGHFVGQVGEEGYADDVTMSASLWETEAAFYANGNLAMDFERGWDVSGDLSANDDGEETLGLSGYASIHVMEDDEPEVSMSMGLEESVANFQLYGGATAEREASAGADDDDDGFSLDTSAYLSGYDDGDAVVALELGSGLRVRDASTANDVEFSLALSDNADAGMELAASVALYDIDHGVSGGAGLQVTEDGWDQKVDLWSSFAGYVGEDGREDVELALSLGENVEAWDATVSLTVDTDEDWNFVYGVYVNDDGAPDVAFGGDFNVRALQSGYDDFTLDFSFSEDVADLQVSASLAANEDPGYSECESCFALSSNLDVSSDGEREVSLWQNFAVYAGEDEEDAAAAGREDFDLALSFGDGVGGFAFSSTLAVDTDEDWNFAYHVDAQTDGDPHVALGGGLNVRAFQEGYHDFLADSWFAEDVAELFVYGAVDADRDRGFALATDFSLVEAYGTGEDETSVSFATSSSFYVDEEDVGEDFYASLGVFDRTGGDSVAAWLVADDDDDGDVFAIMGAVSVGNATGPFADASALRDAGGSLPTEDASFKLYASLALEYGDAAEAAYGAEGFGLSGQWIEDAAGPVDVSWLLSGHEPDAYDYRLDLSAYYQADWDDEHHAFATAESIGGFYEIGWDLCKNWGLDDADASTLEFYDMDECTYEGLDMYGRVYDEADGSAYLNGNFYVDIYETAHRADHAEMRAYLDDDDDYPSGDATVFLDFGTSGSVRRDDSVELEWSSTCVVDDDERFDVGLEAYVAWGDGATCEADAVFRAWDEPDVDAALVHGCMHGSDDKGIEGDAELRFYTKSHLADLDPDDARLELHATGGLDWERTEATDDLSTLEAWSFFAVDGEPKWYHAATAAGTADKTYRGRVDTLLVVDGETVVDGGVAGGVEKHACDGCAVKAAAYDLSDHDVFAGFWVTEDVYDGAATLVGGVEAYGDGEVDGGVAAGALGLAVLGGGGDALVNGSVSGALDWDHRNARDVLAELAVTDRAGQG